MQVPCAASIGGNIGEVSALFGLTPRAIRFYEERGLIATRRDGRNRRVYDEVARRRLQLITALRRSDLPLPDILGVLDCGGGESAQIELALSKLTAQQQRLKDQADQVQRSIEDLAGNLRRRAA